jgi:MOSC domain-containing protein YiiM
LVVESIGIAVVNVGMPTVLAAVVGENVWSGIRKHPVDSSARLWLSEVNLSGDGQADLSVHGGPDKAVYAYPSEHLDAWTWGGATLQVSQPRWPCFKLALHRERADMQARFRASGRTGWYLRVLEPGEVGAAGPIEVSAPDAGGLTVHDAHLAMSDHHLLEPERVRAVANHRALAEQWRVPLLDRLER